MQESIIKYSKNYGQIMVTNVHTLHFGSVILSFVGRFERKTPFFEIRVDTTKTLIGEILHRKTSFKSVW